jgi:hypothetical protein
MKLDPVMHIALHLVSFGKEGVTASLGQKGSPVSGTVEAGSGRRWSACSNEEGGGADKLVSVLALG